MVTIRDVAQKAKVSTSTVSCVINNTGNISEATRRRVLRAIKELGYAPNHAARSLKGKDARLIGLLLSDIDREFSHRLAKGVEKYASESGYFTLFCSTGFDPEKEKAYIKLLQARQVSGIIIGSWRTDRQVAAALSEVEVPLVAANYYVTAGKTSSVVVDNFSAGVDATRYLIGLGHRRIAFISGPENRRASQDRYDGYVRALKDAGLELNPHLVKQGDFFIKGGYRATIELLEESASSTPANRFTAIFAANDDMAVGAIMALRERGWRVPEDLAVLGFDDGRLATSVEPRLTTMYLPMKEVGATAARLLIDLLEGRVDEAQTISVKSRLVVRESTELAAKLAANSPGRPEGVIWGEEIEH